MWNLNFTTMKQKFFHHLFNTIHKGCSCFFYLFSLRHSLSLGNLNFLYNARSLKGPFLFALAEKSKFNTKNTFNPPSSSPVFPLPPRPVLETELAALTTLMKGGNY